MHSDTPSQNNARGVGGLSIIKKKLNIQCFEQGCDRRFQPDRDGLLSFHQVREGVKKKNCPPTSEPPSLDSFREKKILLFFINISLYQYLDKCDNTENSF